MAKFSKKKKPALRVFKPQQKKIKDGNFEFTIDNLSEDGRGIARPLGKATFVRGALPGEHVTGRYLAHHRQFDDAELVEVIHSADERVQPACEHYQDCGGCTLQHLGYSAQLSFKQQRLMTLFRPLSDSQAEPIVWCDNIIAEPLNYRHRLRLAVKANKHSVKIGFRRFNSHDIVDINHCSVTQPALNRLLNSLKRCVTELKSRSSVEEIRLMEDGEGKLSLQLLVKSVLLDEDYQQLSELKASDNLHYIAVSPIKSQGSSPYWQDGEPLSSYQIDQPQCTVGFEIEDFTQVNPAINQLMVSTALHWLALNKDDVVADLFCGVGNFSVPLAMSGVPVVAYELVDAMVAKGRENATRNQLNNLSFKRKDLFLEQKKSSFFYKKQPVTKALLDPPRAGAKALVEQLADSSVSTLLYVSCNPQTLVRDATILQQGGFKLSKATMIDMFPQTTHIETMMLFEKKTAQ